MVQPLRLPKPPHPMTAAILSAYLADVEEWGATDQPVRIGTEVVCNAKVVDGQVILQTYVDLLNDNPPCPTHRPVQHRDGKRPWCDICGLTDRWTEPQSMFQ